MRKLETGTKKDEKDLDVGTSIRQESVIPLNELGFGAGMSRPRGERKETKNLIFLNLALPAFPTTAFFHSARHSNVENNAFKDV